MIARNNVHSGVSVPTFFYGTAWKEDRTEALTFQAIEAGFRAIDTANQRRHYYEAAVGEAVKRAVGAGVVKREELFLQTKFTFAPGQDHRLPYDPNADYTTQVEQSFASSLEHLGMATIDSYILHGPMARHGLSEADVEVWRAMEDLHQSGRTRLIGVSNMESEQLRELLEIARFKPACVQNRCYASTGWDQRVRELCREHGILYQGFSLLTANARELNHPAVHQVAKRLGCSIARVVFRFAMQLGMIPLTGTTSKTHMKEDLMAYDIELTPQEVEMIEKIAA